MLAGFMYDSKFDVMFPLGTTVPAAFGWGQFADATTLLTTHSAFPMRPYVVIIEYVVSWVC